MKNFLSKMLQDLASKLCLPLLLLCGAVQVQAAATTIADDLITVSDGTYGEVWYYIEVPYPSQAGSPMGSIINDHVGRGFTVLTSKGDNTAQFAPLYPTNNRQAQQWKVVANGDGKYSLVNKNGKYLGGDLKEKDNLENAVQLSVSRMNAYFVKALDSSSSALGADPNSTNARFEGNPTHTGIDATSGLPSNGNPGLRTLRFVPVAGIDSSYPFIFESGATITKWFYIKSLDTANAAAPYLTLKEDGTTFELAEKSAENIGQLFGFVSSDNGEKTFI
ncbi:MAG: RICIN domain-containing protein, partial [Prevotellaceae bacterium]|nr:RICIN domain-containing protein [Prevotellaceae bacterium]